MVFPTCATLFEGGGFVGSSVTGQFDCVDVDSTEAVVKSSKSWTFTYTSSNLIILKAPASLTA